MSTKSATSKKLFTRGCEASARYLKRIGYDILERDWECEIGGFDIIARVANTVVFCDVHVRSDAKRGFPQEAYSSKDRTRAEKRAMAYLSHSDFVDVPVRFDRVDLVVLSDSRALIRHHIGVFSTDK